MTKNLIIFLFVETGKGAKITETEFEFLHDSITLIEEWLFLVRSNGLSGSSDQHTQMSLTKIYIQTSNEANDDLLESDLKTQLSQVLYRHQKHLDQSGQQVIRTCTPTKLL